MGGGGGGLGKWEEEARIRTGSDAAITPTSTVVQHTQQKSPECQDLSPNMNEYNATTAKASISQFSRISLKKGKMALRNCFGLIAYHIVVGWLGLV